MLQWFFKICSLVKFFIGYVVFTVYFENNALVFLLEGINHILTFLYKSPQFTVIKEDTFHISFVYSQGFFCSEDLCQLLCALIASIFILFMSLSKLRSDSSILHLFHGLLLSLLIVYSSFVLLFMFRFLPLCSLIQFLWCFQVHVELSKLMLYHQHTLVLFQNTLFQQL